MLCLVQLWSFSVFEPKLLITVCSSVAQWYDFSTLNLTHKILKMRQQQHLISSPFDINSNHSIISSQDRNICLGGLPILATSLMQRILTGHTLLSVDLLSVDMGICKGAAVGTRGQDGCSACHCHAERLLDRLQHGNLLWVCLTACKALIRVNAWGQGINSESCCVLVIRSLD